MSAPTRDSNPAVTMDFDVDGECVRMPLEAVIVAGFTGRDAEAVQRHIDELRLEGVSAPSTVPSFYVLPAAALQQADELVTVHAGTSGEAEPVLLVDDDAYYITVGSDHTDRRAESLDIGLSKQACPKIVARTAWPLADVAGRWDELIVESWLGPAREPYQSAALAGMLAPDDLLARIPFARRPACFALLMGTVPVLGRIRGAAQFHAALHDPARERSIEISYDVRVLDLMESAG